MKKNEAKINLFILYQVKRLTNGFVATKMKISICYYLKNNKNGSHSLRKTEIPKANKRRMKSPQKAH
ncbi:hypothetical protein, partial [Vibrio vulnificus]|uniref:hypothetical protein n=1 Tax=Vibrio vulnificus TaxID=672 RepID=UPI0019D45EE6